MKRNLISATLIATLLAAPAAFAAPLGTGNESPDPLPVNVAPLAQKGIVAGSIYSTKELTRRGISASDDVSVSVIPSGGSAVRLGRG
ncbi:MAG: hypothetical protein R3D46_04945 [Defluviimonas denitrificans]